MSKTVKKGGSVKKAVAPAKKAPAKKSGGCGKKKGCN